MMNNKKLELVAAFVMAAGVSAQAQEQKFSKWTVTPRVGFNVSNLVEGKAPGKDSKLGFTGGADVEYRPVKFLGVSLGCYFNTQNSSVDFVDVYDGTTWGKIQRTHTLAMYNVSAPLMLNFHVWKGLAVKTGVQLVYWNRSRLKYDFDGYRLIPTGSSGTFEFLPDGSLVGDYEKKEYHGKGSSKVGNMDLSLTMPIALSYEYKNVELDVRYLMGAYKLFSNDFPNHHPKSLLVTIGYNFHMK